MSINAITRGAWRFAYRIRPYILAAALLPALCFPQVASAACERVRDKFGVWRSDCQITTDLKSLQSINVRFDQEGPHYQIQLPDLQIFKYKFDLIGSDLYVKADIRNTGLSGSAPTTVAVTIEIYDPDGAYPISTIDAVGSVPAIAAGATQRVLVTTVSLPNAADGNADLDDFDVWSSGIVDPPSPPARPSGAMYESNETNNAREHMCRVYGDDPVRFPTPPPVCD